MLRVNIASIQQCNFHFPCKLHSTEETFIIYTYYCIFVKLSFYYRTYNSVQNGVQVEKFMTILLPVRSKASFKSKLILYKKHGYIFESEKGVWQPKSLLLQTWRRFWTPLDPRNSENSKRTLYILRIEIVLPLFKAFCTMYYLNQVPVGHIMSYVQSAIIIVFLV